jgi:hypothetical protein
MEDILMDTMAFLVWFMPVIFMIHDFEEILMAEIWGKRYRMKIGRIFPKRRPFGLGEIKAWQTPTFSIGVAIEFLIFSAISFFSVLFQNYLLWYGAFLGLLIHMVFLHIQGCFWFKGYVPGVITSAILLLPGIWVLALAQNILQYGWGEILIAALIGFLLLAIIIPSLHKLMGVLSGWLDRYALEQKVD